MYSWVSLLEGYLANMKSELHVGGLVQTCSISSALTMDILQYYNKTFICAVRAPIFNRYREVWSIQEYVYNRTPNAINGLFNTTTGWFMNRVCSA